MTHGRHKIMNRHCAMSAANEIELEPLVFLGNGYCSLIIWFCARQDKKLKRNWRKCLFVLLNYTKSITDLAS